MSPSPAELQRDPRFPQLKAMAIELTGMTFYADKDESLAAAFARRMKAAGAADGTAYLRLLTGDQAVAEKDALAAELTIGETYFLRHAGQWTAFTDRIIPDILARKADIRQLRIWSAGCATGAEAYTAAILLKERFGRELKDWDVGILGTDINRRFLAAARAARFGSWSFRATPDDLRDRCFTRAGSHWELKPDYRAWTSFQYHNLVRDRVPLELGSPDLIFCRNVFIYFDQETNARILAEFHKSLPEGGWLLVGHAEPDMRLFRDYEAVMLPDAVLYRKPEGGVVRPQPLWTKLAPKPSLQLPPPAASRPRRQPSAPVRRAPPAKPAPLPPMPVPQPPAAAPALAEEVEQLIRRGDWEGAAAACQRWLSQEPLDPWVHFCLGMVHEQRGSVPQAIEAYRRALYLDRTALIAHYQLGCLLRPTDQEGAQRCFRNVLDLSQRTEPTAAVRGVPGITVEELRQAAQTQITQLERPS